MKRYWWIVLILLVGVLIYNVAKAEIIDEWYGTMYVSPDQVNVEWDHAEDDRVTHYEVEAVWIDQNPPQVVEIGTTSEKSMVVERPRTGHFVIRVRSVAEDLEDGDGNTLKSEWATSSDPEDTNDDPWRVYFVVPAIDDSIVIE